MDDQDNYKKLNLLLRETLPYLLRKIFKETWLKSSGKPWGNTPTDGKELIDKLEKKFYSKEMNIQKDYLTSGDINKWNLPFLVKIIIQLSSQDPSLTPEEKSNIDSLNDLVQIRDKLSYIEIPVLSIDEYNSNWSAIVEVLEQNGVSEEKFKITTVETPSVTPVSEKNSKEAKKIKEIANELLGKGDVKTAIDRYSEALQFVHVRTDEQAVIYSNRSKAFLDLEVADTDKAIEDAEQAINLRPRWWKGYFRAAIAYETAKNFQKAIELYSIALTFPEGTEIEKRVGTCQFRKSLNEIEAKDLYRSMRECVATIAEVITNSEEKIVIIASDWEVIAQGHQEREAKKYQAAYESFQRAKIMRDDGNAESIFNSAMLKMTEIQKNGNITESIQSLETAAMQKSSGNVGVAESQFVLGLYYHVAAKNYEKAKLWYEKSAKNLNGLATYQLGVMHDEGIGFPVNRETAVEFWIKAANSKQKVVSAMESLSKHFLEAFSFPLAIKWHTTALENGSKLLHPKKDIFESDVDDLENYWNMSRILENRCTLMLNTFHISMCLNQIEIYKAFKMRVDLKVKDIVQDHFKYNPRDKNTPLPETILSLTNEMIRKLKEADKKGNVAAKRLLEKHDHHYKNAMIFLMSENSEEEISFNEIIREMASEIRLVQSFKYINEETKIKIWEKLKVRLPGGETEKSEMDRDFRVCYCYFGALSYKTLDWIFSYAEESSQKYPREVFFHSVMGDIYEFKKDYESGMKEANISLELLPKNHVLLHKKAALDKMCGVVPVEDVIQDYLEFIKYAPCGDRMIPDAYYEIVLFYAERYRENIDCENRNALQNAHSNMVKYMELGKQSENKLALPYSGKVKVSAEKRLDLLTFHKRFINL